MKNIRCNYLILLILLIGFNFVFSQEQKLNIEQDPKIDSLLQKKIQLDRERFNKTYFTLQLHYGDLVLAEEVLMRSKEKLRLSTLRLINAAIKDKDIALRMEDRPDGVSSSEILQILGKMVKQRQESARAYEEGGRLELAQQELSEIKIIEEFLPRQLNDEDVAKVIEEVISDIGATSIRDMGKVMASLKETYTGQMDFGQVGAKIKSLLG